MVKLLHRQTISALRLVNRPCAGPLTFVSISQRRQQGTAVSYDSEQVPAELPCAPPSPRPHPAPSPASASPRISSLKTAKPFSAFLTDTFNRQHDYLRISVTERCNLRCLYCMPEEGVPLSPPAHLLTTPEIVYLSALFVSQGVTKIRLTGGEPTVRKDIIPMMQAIGKLRRDGLRELCLTTNGISLHRKLDGMVEAGLTGVNLSLDTLDPFQFQIMTRRKGFEAVMKSIDRILEMNRMGAGIKLKINCVVMRGLNDREIIPFVEMGREKPIEVRFIEYMPFDGNKWSQGKMFPFKDMLTVIREKYPTLEKVADHKSDTSKTYHIPGFQGRVGFITSMTHNFCGTCNRLRITSDGNLKVCLFGNAEVSLRDIIRKANDGQPIDDQAMEALGLLDAARRVSGGRQEGLAVDSRERELLDVIGMAVHRKKAKHAGMGELEKMKNRPMILIDESKSPNNRVSKQSSTRTISRQSALSTWSSIPSHILPARQLPCPQLRAFSSKPSSSSASSGYTRETTASSATHSPTVPGLPIASHPLVPHLTPSETVHMTSISDKPETRRLATATCRVTFSNPTPYSIFSTGDGHTKKGDVLSVARIAGIMAAKRTPDLVPLAHPGLGITGVEVDVVACQPDTSPPSLDENKNTSASAGAQVSQKEYVGGSQPHGSVLITSTVHCHGRTGVEMEALTSVLGAALTVYDMCKAVDKGMVIEEARVVRKRGGRSGDWELGVRVGGGQADGR